MASIYFNSAATIITGISPNLVVEIFNSSAITIPGIANSPISGQVVDIDLIVENCDLQIGDAGPHFTYANINPPDSNTFVNDFGTYHPGHMTGNYGFYLHLDENTGTTVRSKEILVTFYDTSGNTYPLPLLINQQPNPVTPTGGFHFQASAATASTTATGLVFYIIPDDITIETGTNYTYSVSGNMEITSTQPIREEYPYDGSKYSFGIHFDKNSGTTDREAYITLTLHDTSGNTYSDTVYIVQPWGKYFYFEPSGSSHVSSAASTASWTAIGVNCTFSGLSITGESSSGTWDSQPVSALSGNILTFQVPANTGVSRNKIYRLRVTDTDSNNYGLVCQIIQSAASNPSAWTIDYPGNSAYTVIYNSSTMIDRPLFAKDCTFDHLTFTTSGGGDHGAVLSAWTIYYGPDPSVPNYTGFYLRMDTQLNTNRTGQDIPAYITVSYYDTEDQLVGSETYLFIFKTIGTDASICAITSDISVTSASTTSSLTITSANCEYDHFTYMTGGSMEVTVTQGPGNTLIIDVPQNNTPESRVGYVYITFYDTNGFTYQQTITIRQDAGPSGPTPPPGSYVLTSLTISDNEQHRFFVEARAGYSYSANGIAYKTISACEARYSLYYINSYGGVDVLVFKGRGNKKTDNITRLNYSRSFRNNTLEFENVNYMNEIKATWELQTGWMTDKQSKNMKELVESTHVFLYDALEKEYIPVVMTDKTLEYKTYKNQNNRFYNYTVKVEESKSKERR